MRPQTRLSAAFRSGMGERCKVALSPDGARAYVTLQSNLGPSRDALAVVDTATNAIIARISGVVQPFGVVVTPDGAHVYVVNSYALNGLNAVSVIDTATNTIVDT